MQVSEYALFPTKLIAIQLSDADALNRDLVRLMDTEYPPQLDDADHHPSRCNLLHLEGQYPCIGRLRDMFMTGLTHWLRSERVTGDLSVSLVLFPNVARKGNYTLVHNHSAEMAGVYYVETAPYPQGPAISLPGDEHSTDDYFTEDDGVLVLHDPRFNANLGSLKVEDYVKVRPRPGQMLIFPGFLWHSVTPYLGEQRRLSVAANFTISWQEETPGFRVPLQLR